MDGVLLASALVWLALGIYFLRVARDRTVVAGIVSRRWRWQRQLDLFRDDERQIKFELVAWRVVAILLIVAGTATVGFLAASAV